MPDIALLCKMWHNTIAGTQRRDADRERVVHDCVAAVRERSKKSACCSQSWRVTSPKSEFGDAEVCELASRKSAALAMLRSQRRPEVTDLNSTTCRAAPVAIGNFPCCVDLPSHACRRHYPGGLTGCVHRSLHRPYQPSPEFLQGRHPQFPFLDLLNVHYSLPPACSQNHPR
jgi:hypothetical protein